MNGPNHLSFLFFLLLLVGLSPGMGMTEFNIGVILDMDTWVGNISWSCISMAMDDFYAAHPNYSTRLVLHLRNSKEDVVTAASAAINLLKDVQVQAILGPQTSTQAKFVAELGNKSQVPIISFSATCPYLYSPRIPYFIRTAFNDSTQAMAIAALVQSFKWREAILIYEDTDYGSGITPYLIHAFQAIGAGIHYMSMISLSMSDHQIAEELQILKKMQTSIFIVHSSSTLGSRLFLKAIEEGMMSEGYAWIVTYGLTEYLNFMDSSTIDAMQGVLSINPYVFDSNRLDDFKERWQKKFHQENPTAKKVAQIGIFGLWAYDSVWALAMAVERIRVANSRFRELLDMANYSTDLASIGLSPNGQKLLSSMLLTNFNGVSGAFQLVTGQLEPTTFEIINVIGIRKKRIGFWNSTHGISSKNMNFKASLTGIVWPGDSVVVPRDLNRQTGGKKLRIGIPVKFGFNEFVNQEWNPSTFMNGSGFCLQVFDMVMESLSNNIPYEYVPFEDANGRMNGSYDDLIHQVYLQKLDAVVGDVSITRNRSLYVDFTVRYTEPGVSMVVRTKDGWGKSGWVFLKPMTVDLWLTILAFFIYTGFVVWVMEHRINEGFRGPPINQLGTIFYFSFSTLVFAHRENLVSNFTRMVVIVWVFVVFILTSSYTASLTSMLTVQQINPAVTNLNELIRNGDYVGYMGDPSSFLGLESTTTNMFRRLREYESPEEYDEALSKGSSRGGVTAIITEVPYIKAFISQYCDKYTMVGPIYNSDGFGFVFPKGSSLAIDISGEISKSTEKINNLYKNLTTSSDPTCAATPNSLTFDTFWGLFLITGITSTLALIIFLSFFLHEHWHVLVATDAENSLWRRLAITARLFDQRDHSSHAFKKSEKKDEPSLGVQGIADLPYADDDSRRPSSFSNQTYTNSTTEEGGTPEIELGTHIVDSPSFPEIVHAMV